MRWLRISILMPGVFFLSLRVLYATEVNIVWQEPEKFQDIEAGNLMAQKRFQQEVIFECAIIKPFYVLNPLESI